MCRIDDLVGEIVFEVSKQITLRPRVEIETRFVQQQNRAIGFAVFGIRREHDIEREKPLEATASFIKVHFNVIRAHYPEIKSSNPSVRAFNERAAINAPIQGSAADIIRRAMVKMEPALAAAGLSARMLLQVHDELIFEVEDGEVDRTIPVIVDIMENASMPALSMKVPLKVDARAAVNWDEAH